MADELLSFLIGSTDLAQKPQEEQDPLMDFFLSDQGEPEYATPGQPTEDIYTPQSKQIAPDQYTTPDPMQITEPKLEQELPSTTGVQTPYLEPEPEPYIPGETKTQQQLAMETPPEKPGIIESMTRSVGAGAADLAINFARIPETAAEVFVSLNNLTNRGANKLIEVGTGGKVKEAFREVPHEAIPNIIKLDDQAKDVKALRDFSEKQHKIINTVTDSKDVLDHMASGDMGKAAKTLGVQVAGQVPLILSMIFGGAAGAGAKVLGGLAGATETASKMDNYWKTVEAGTAKQDPNVAGVHALVSGAIEALGETLVTGKLIQDALKKMTKVTSEKVAKKAVGNAVGAVVGKILKAGGGEALEEGIVNYSQAVSDHVFGERDVTFLEAIKEGANGALVGFFASAGTTGPLSAYADTKGQKAPIEPPVESVEEPLPPEITPAEQDLQQRVQTEQIEQTSPVPDMHKPEVVDPLEEVLAQNAEPVEPEIKKPEKPKEKETKFEKPVPETKAKETDTAKKPKEKDVETKETKQEVNVEPEKSKEAVDEITKEKAVKSIYNNLLKTRIGWAKEQGKELAESDRKKLLDSSKSQAETIIDDVKNKNIDNLVSRLSVLDNKGSRGAFKEITGITLPNTASGTTEAIKLFVGTENYNKHILEQKKKADQKKAEEKEKQKQLELGDLLDTKVLNNNRTTTYRDIIKDRVDKGWVVEKTKRGIRNVYTLTDGNKQIALPNKMLGEYAENLVNQNIKPKQEVKKPEVVEPVVEEKKPENVGGIAVGDRVYMKDWESNGTVTSIDSQKSRVMVKGDNEAEGGTYSVYGIRDGTLKKIEPTKKETKTEETPKENFSEKIKGHLKTEKVDNRLLFKMAKDHYGGSWQDGKYDPRDVYDATEEAMNKVISEDAKQYADFDNPEKTLKNLLDLTDRLPRQSIRSTDQIELQQFSTPPGESFVAVSVSGIEKGMNVLEPSAGTGNIATMAKLKGGNVVTNEISKKRQKNLKALGFDVYEVDGEQLHNMLPDKVKPDVIVMNPPFSSTGGRVKTHKTKFGAQHVEQALLRLNKGGRLVAIVGEGMAHGKPAFNKWWEKIENKYNVRANIGMDGKYYGKLGTTFGNQILVIDKTGPTPGETRVDKIGNIIINDKLSPEEALSLLKPLAKEDINGRIKTVERKSKSVSKEETRTEDREPSVPGDVKPRDTKPSGKVGGELERSEPGDVSKPDRRKPEGDRKDSGKDSKPGEQGVSRKEPGGIRERDSADDTGRIERAEGKSTSKLEEEEGGVFAKYRVQKAVYKNSKPHPANVVESAALAGVEPPDVNYTPNLPKDVIGSGKLSDLQLEAITYAGQRHSQKLPDGSIPEYWIGDGTGIGKGREIAGIIYDNWNQGRKKAVWISISKDLYKDAKRDLEGVGVPVETFRQGSAKLKDDISLKEGVLFTQYTTLRQNWSGTRDRYEQLKKWLGPDYDGVIVFDEAHQLKNAQVTQFDNRKASEGSDQGAMGVHLKKEFPKARFVNVSATGATNPTNLGYLSRMGLWGTGAPFADFTQFLRAMSDGGVGAMEMLSRDLKAVGAYNSRSISYDGVGYDQVIHELSEDEIKMYDRVADLWSDIMRAFEEGMENAGMTKKESTNMYSQFYSAQQRFFLQYMVALQVPDMIKDAESQLKQGNSVVISLYNTNEQAVKNRVAKAIAEDIDLENLTFTSKEMVADLIERHFPVNQYQEKTDELTGKTIRVPVKDSAGNPVINKENLEKRENLIETLVDFELPGNPFDLIVNHFGPKKIAEISGRKSRLEGKKLVKRKISGVPSKAINDAETANFQAGKKRIAIISGAASTGISLHSDQNAKNQQRRVFYALQLSWSADTQMQSFGRVHRSFQKVPPVIKMVRTNLSGQQRLINTISKRLASLGAVSSGTRDAYTGSLFDIEDITDDYGKAALSWLFRHKIGRSTVERMGLLNSKGDLKNGKDTDVEGFLNRIMALPFKQQNKLFGGFYSKYQELTEQAREDGTFDVGVQQIDADNLKKVSEENIYTHKESGATTNLVTLEGDVKAIKVSSSLAENTAKGRTESKVYYIKNKRSGNYLIAYQTKHDERNDKRTILNTRGNTTKVTPEDIKNKFEQIERSEWKSEWDKQYAKIPDIETKKFNLITGAVFPIYDKLFSDADFKTGIYKASTKNKNYIGVLIPENKIVSVKQNLGIGAKLAKLSPSELLDLIEKNNSIIQLDNGWTIRKTKVKGEEIIKVDPKTNVIPTEEAYGLGIKSYVVDYKRIYFIPSESAEKVIADITKVHMAIKDITGDENKIQTSSKSNLKYFEVPSSGKNKSNEKLRSESVVNTAKKSKAKGKKKISQVKAVSDISKQIQHNPGGEKKGSGWLNPFEYGYFKVKEIAWPILKIRKVLLNAKIAVKEKTEEILDAFDYAVDRVRSAGAMAQNHIDENYNPIFAPLKDMPAKESGLIARSLSQYLVAKRSEWLYNNKEKYHDEGISLETAETVIDYIENDHPQGNMIVGMAEKLWDYNKGLIDIKHKHGVIDDQLLQNLREPYYVPFFRDVDTKKHKISGPPRKIMFTATSTGIKRIKGTKEALPVIDPLQLMLATTHETIVNANRAVVAQNIVKFAQAYPELFDGLVVKTDPKWVRAGTIEHRIQVDATLRGQIDDYINKMGFSVKTKSKLGRQKGGTRLGVMDDQAQEVRILYGATESTRAHELGHVLDQEIPWLNKLLSDPKYKNELTAVAGSRYEGEEVAGNKFHRYVHQQDEKVAEFIALYLSNRPMLRNMAPLAVSAFESKLESDQVLKGLKNIRPTNVKDVESFEEANWVLDNSIPKDEDVISLRMNGKLESYRVPIEMALSVKNLHPKQIPMWLKWTLALPTRTLRFGAVTGNPDFFIPNVSRDQLDSAHNAKTIPFVDWFIGAKHYMTNSDIFKLYQKRGGGMDSPESGISGSSKGYAEMIYGSKAKQLLDPFYLKNRGILKVTSDVAMMGIKFPFKPILYMCELSEMGTRLGVFNRSLKSQKIDINNIQGKDAHLAIGHAIHAARQSTIDFQRFGYSGKIPNEIFPFINAALEGIDRTARAWVVPISEGKVPVRPIMYTGLIYGLYAGLTAWNEQDEEYKNIPAREKANNWIIMLGGKVFLKIPKGHVAKLILNPAQMIYENMKGLANQTGWDLATNIFMDISPIDQGSVLPVLVKLIIEPLPGVNYNFYFQTHIVNPTQRALPPGQRSKKSTSETLKTIGRALNWDPIVMQHEIVTSLGGTGRNLLWITDWVLGTTGIQKPPGFDASKAIIVRRFYGEAEEWKSDTANRIDTLYKRIRELKWGGKSATIAKKLRKTNYSNAEISKAVIARQKELEKCQRKLIELQRAQKKIQLFQNKIKSANSGIKFR